MRNLWICALAFIFLAGVNANINGLWQFDWQNAAVGTTCVPQYVNITQNATFSYSVIYSYDPATQSQLCVNPLSTSSLTNTTTSGVYNDTIGQVLTFSADGTYMQFTPNGTNTSFYFQINNTMISQQATFGTLGASWNSPMLVNSTSGANCTCAPDTIFIIPNMNNQGQDANLTYSTYYISSNCSANLSNAGLYISNSNTTSINWVDNTTTATVDVSYTPSVSANNITVIFNASAGNNSCGYSYQRANVTLFSGQWQQDWQSAQSAAFPTDYQVTSVSSTYMTSKYQFSGSTPRINSYVAQNPSGYYQDAYLGQSFTYNNVTNTLLSQSGQFLYSPNGSLFNPSLFIGFWGTPIAAGNVADCCIPTFVNITATPNSTNLTTAYILPEDYTSAGSPCDIFTTDVYNGTLEGSLYIPIPNITQLNWVDVDHGIAISFSSPANSSQISMQIPGQCLINMVITAPPNPNPNPPGPKPLSGSWISTKAMGLVMGLSVILACM